MTSDTDKLLDERAKTHGDFAVNAGVAQQIKEVIRNSSGYRNLNALQIESLDMIASKIGRILGGNANEPDHWNDIAGYAKLPLKYAKRVGTSEENVSSVEVNQLRTDPELLRLLKKAAAQPLTPEMVREQRRSWVRGELMMAYPELSREEADRRVREAEKRMGYETD